MGVKQLVPVKESTQNVKRQPSSLQVAVTTTVNPYHTLNTASNFFFFFKKKGNLKNDDMMQSDFFFSLFLRNYNLSSENLTLLKDPLIEIGLITWWTTDRKLIYVKRGYYRIDLFLFFKAGIKPPIFCISIRDHFQRPLPEEFNWD